MSDSVVSVHSPAFFFEFIHLGRNSGGRDARTLRGVNAYILCGANVGFIKMV
jgi:hypothetical protein